MEFKQLQSFVEVVKYQSFTKAAEELCITQPAISQHVRVLESELKTKLFDRTKNEIVLTENGRIVVKYLKRMIGLSNSMVQAVHDEKTNMTSVNAGITHTVESSMIIEALASYANSKDNVSVKVISDTAENLKKMLKNYELDFLIIDGRIEDPHLNNVLLCNSVCLKAF